MISHTFHAGSEQQSTPTLDEPVRHRTCADPQTRASDLSPQRSFRSPLLVVDAHAPQGRSLQKPKLRRATSGIYDFKIPVRTLHLNLRSSLARVVMAKNVFGSKAWYQECQSLCLFNSLPSAPGDVRSTQQRIEQWQLTTAVFIVPCPGPNGW